MEENFYKRLFINKAKPNKTNEKKKNIRKLIELFKEKKITGSPMQLIIYKRESETK